MKVLFSVRAADKRNWSESGSNCPTGQAGEVFDDSILGIILFFGGVGEVAGMVCSKPLRGNFLDPLLVKTLTRIVCGKKKCPKVCVFQRWAFPTVLRRSLHPLWILQRRLISSKLPEQQSS